MVNCNLQHYSGESGLTYFTQLFVIMLFQFITAATGMAAMAGIMNALSKKTTKTIGNFWDYLVLSSTRILLPLSLVVGFILITQGTPMGFDGKMEVTTLEEWNKPFPKGLPRLLCPLNSWERMAAVISALIHPIRWKIRLTFPTWSNAGPS